MWFDEDVLVGFLGIYGYRPDQVELCGMVHPSSRRQGIFSRLFEAAIAEVRLRGVPEALLVVDRLYEGGTAFARHLGAEIEHSEHRMVWRREPAEFTPDPSVKIREATRSDIAFIIKCLTEAFDFPAEALEAEEEDTLARRYPGTYVIERAGELVGTIHVEHATAVRRTSTGSRSPRPSRAKGSAARCCRVSPETSGPKAPSAWDSRCRAPTTVRSGCI